MIILKIKAGTSNTCLGNSSMPSNRNGLCSPVRIRGFQHMDHTFRGGIGSVWQDCPSHSHSVSDSYRGRSEMGLCFFVHQKTNDCMKEKTVWSYATLRNSPFKKHLQIVSVSSVCNQRQNRFPEPLDQLIQDTQDI